MPVFVIVDIHAQPGKAVSAAEVIKGSQAFCLSYDACRRFDVLKEDGDEHHFCFYQIWDSIADHKKMLAALMSDTAFLDKLNANFVSGPDIRYFTDWGVVAGIKD